MQMQSQNTGDQSKQQLIEDIQTLRQKITFTNSQIHEIISNSDNFSQRIKLLNQKAIKQIICQNYQQAIVYLTQAEKNLQYAANCGLTIDRILITTILKNQACAYQRLWELGTCYDYIQALIYNFNSNLDNPYELLASQQIINKNSETSKKFNKILNKKINIALCYLQFSALSSQLSKHEQARRYVQKSLDQFKTLCQLCQSYQKSTKRKTTTLLQQIRDNIQFNTQIRISKLLKECKNGLDKIKNIRHFFSYDSKIVESLSMGDIMQIQYLSFQQAMKPKETEWFISQLGLTYIIIYISCCFFALATQIRLGSQKQILSEQQVDEQIKLAKTYHLHSINMASNLVLIQSNFLTHIIKSFRNNFGMDITTYNFDQQQDQFEQISQIKIKQQKIEQQLKAIESLKKNNQHKKNDDEVTTKFPTIQSDSNSNPQKKEKRNTLGHTKKQSRKVSIVQPKIGSKKPSKKFLLKQLTEQVRNSRSKNNKLIKSRNKQKKSTSRNKNILNNQYFSKIQVKIKNTQNNTKKLVSPKSKLTRKTEQSRSRPKLKLNNIKSPNKI